MLKETALVELHKKLGAKLVDFGGWNMPLHYGSQMEEHHFVRKSAGVFDVSHMTVVDVSGADAKAYLQKLLANDVARLTQVGKALYSGMLNDKGGVIDDLIVYLREEGYRLVVNCATREKDLAWMNAQTAGFEVQLTERPDFAMLAVQGPEARPKAIEVIGKPELEELGIFFGTELRIDASEWFVARTGYTGEDGFEIMLPLESAEAFLQALVDAGVAPCGLGARDTLRLEAGMNLYGHEMDDDVSPLEANMGWTLAWEPAEREFSGRSSLEAQRSHGVEHKLVGLVIQGKGVLRAGQEVVCDGVEGRGVITSGSFSPTMSTSIALARVPVSFLSAEAQCDVLIRNKRVPVKIVKPCFVRNGEVLVEA